MKVIDFIGKQSGRLTVVKRAENSKNGKARWDCACECGNYVTVSSQGLQTGVSRSCGCLKRQLCATVSRTHGQKGTRTYARWTAMKRRVADERKGYATRGITVCNRWKYSYVAFLRDMGECPSDAHTLERLDNNVGYQPPNCIWATRTQQARNRRTSRCVDFHGARITVAEFAERLGVKSSLIYSRLNAGFGVDEIIAEFAHVKDVPRSELT
jgi:hypothetical protein